MSAVSDVVLWMVKSTNHPDEFFEHEQDALDVMTRLDRANARVYRVAGELQEYMVVPPQPAKLEPVVAVASAE